MDSIVTKKTLSDALDKKVSREEAEKAVETLIKWAGDNPKREGLKGNPKELSKLLRSFFLDIKNLQKIIYPKPLKMFRGTRIL